MFPTWKYRIQLVYKPCLTQDNPRARSHSTLFDESLTTQDYRFFASSIARGCPSYHGHLYCSRAHISIYNMGGMGEEWGEQQP